MPIKANIDSPLRTPQLSIICQLQLLVTEFMAGVATDGSFSNFRQGLSINKKRTLRTSVFLPHRDGHRCRENHQHIQSLDRTSRREPLWPRLFRGKLRRCLLRHPGHTPKGHSRFFGDGTGRRRRIPCLEFIFLCHRPNHTSRWRHVRSPLNQIKNDDLIAGYSPSFNL
jgi:hypothetical protein